MKELKRPVKINCDFLNYFLLLFNIGVPSKSIDTLFPKVETLNKKLLIQAKEKTEQKVANASYRKDILESQKETIIRMNMIELLDNYKIN